MPWTPDTGSQPGLRKGSSGHRGVRFQEFVLLWFSAGRGWMPAGVASQKTDPVAGDIARFAPPYTVTNRKDPFNINGLRVTPNRLETVCNRRTCHRLTTKTCRHPVFLPLSQPVQSYPQITDLEAKGNPFRCHLKKCHPLPIFLDRFSQRTRSIACRIERLGL